MSFVRPPAVAGLFYPDDPRSLRTAVEQYLARAVPPPAGIANRCPKALIAPHAGFQYSGPIAGSAYALIGPYADTLRRILLLGPSHRVPLWGVAASSAEAFRSPLGSVAVDRQAVEAALALPWVIVDDRAHAREHSLEVHLPFLQMTCPAVPVVPFAVGDATTEQVSAVLDRLWGGPETLIIVSSDLSHYYDYATAQQLDRRTAAAIVELRPEALDGESACGWHPVRGLLHAAARRGLHAWTVDLRNSGDTAGGKEEVVGYGAFAFA